LFTLSIIEQKLSSSCQRPADNAALQWLMAYGLWLVGKINVPFQHKNKLYRGQGLASRFSSARLRMANDTITSRPQCLFVQRWQKRERIGEAHLSNASAYNWVETNQPTTTKSIYQFNVIPCVIAVLQFLYACLTTLVV